MLLFHWLQCPVLIHLNKSLCVFWFRTFFFSEVGYGYLCLVIAKNERQLFVAGWVSLVLAVEGCPGTFWFNRHEVRSTTVVWQQVSLSAKTFSVALSSIIVGSKSRKGRGKKKLRLSAWTCYLVWWSPQSILAFEPWVIQAGFVSRLH